MTEQLVAGVDSSTQSVKVLLVRACDGRVVDQAQAAHPAGTEVDPAAWWEALQRAGSGLLDRAAAIGVAGQQHGMVAVDAAGGVVRPALLWNDLRSAPQAVDVIDRLGGRRACAETIGSVPTASFTVTKLRWMAGQEPENAVRTVAVLLPHDWLTWKLTGSSDPATAMTDHGDASGTGYYSPARREWLPELAGWALGRTDPPILPTLVGPGQVAARTPGGQLLAAGTGDNMGAALGLGIGPGDVVVSIGTSGTAFGRTGVPSADPSGVVAGFCDASGGYLPLVCTLNATNVLATVGGLLDVGYDEFAALALAGSPGAHGLTLLPYLDGERTPDRPQATGELVGLTSATTREDLARAAVEALLCSLADAVDALPMAPRRVLMIGGGARNPAVRQLAPAVLGRPVTVPEPAEYVALGAARQAAWVLGGGPRPPDWPAAPAVVHRADPTPQVRAAYAALRDL